MTKQELMENYTAEQLAEMVIELENELKTARNLENEVLFEERIADNIRNVTGMNIDDVRKAVQDTKKYMNDIYTEELKNQIEHTKSEVEKYRKAFENAKKERNKQVCEYQKKIDELTAKNKEYLDQIMASKPLLYGCSVSEVARAIFEHCNSNAVRLSNKNRFDYSEEIEKAGKDGCEIYILGLIKCLQGLCNGENYTEENLLSKFLPAEPIKVADMLINAEGEYEHNPIVKAFCGTDKGTYRIFDVSELRQIAEHLLAYCNHHGEAEE